LDVFFPFSPSLSLCATAAVKFENLEQVRTFFADVHARGGKAGAWDLSGLNRLLEHKAEDMTATVQAGMTVRDFQKNLAVHGQWLPVDPPNPDGLSLESLLATNASGPRRFGFGTVRDYVIGLAVVLADGRLIHSGGKVVKNVAGYDLMKLFIGSRGTLGVIVEATFKVLPLSETERFVEAACDSLRQADTLIQCVLDSELTPVVLDLHYLTPTNGQFSVVLGFSGTREEVEWQLARSSELGFNGPCTLSYQEEFFNQAAPHALSVLPSMLMDTLDSLEHSRFVARAGNGIIYHYGAPPTGNRVLTKLEERLKNEFDPKHIFPSLLP